GDALDAIPLKAVEVVANGMESIAFRGGDDPALQVAIGDLQAVAKAAVTGRRLQDQTDANVVSVAPEIPVNGVFDRQCRDNIQLRLERASRDDLVGELVVRDRVGDPRIVATDERD